MFIPPFLFRPSESDDFPIADWQDFFAFIAGIVLALGFFAIVLAIIVRTLD